MLIRCARCKEEKITSLFHKNSKNKTGCASWCKECRRLGNLPGDPSGQQKFRVCTACRESKKTSEFRSQATAKTPCLKCLGGKRSKAGYPKTPEKTRRHREEIKALYGLDEQSYYEILDLQDRRCPGCGEPPSRINLSVDHCHREGVIRGLLCVDCNLALGRVKDKVQTLKNLISYLESPTTRLNIPKTNLARLAAKRARKGARATEA